jgi:hypothetical protein
MKFLARYLQSQLPPNHPQFPLCIPCKRSLVAGHYCPPVSLRHTVLRIIIYLLQTAWENHYNFKTPKKNQWAHFGVPSLTLRVATIANPGGSPMVRWCFPDPPAAPHFIPSSVSERSSLSGCPLSLVANLQNHRFCHGKGKKTWKSRVKFSRKNNGMIFGILIHPSVFGVFGVSPQLLDVYNL